jgi:DNA polymerase III subunit beta
MRIEADRDQLLKSIGIAESVISAKSVNIILSNCLFNVSKDNIEIISTDNEIGVRTRMSAVSDSEKSFTVNGKKLASIVKELPQGNIIIDISDSFLLDIKSKNVKGHYSLIGGAKGDFPDLPKADSKDSIEMEQSVLRNMIRKVIYAAATDSIKPVFNGIYFISEEKGKLSAVASDIRRLSMTTLEVDKNIMIAEGIIVPLKTVNEIYRLLTIAGNCSMKIGKSQCFFRIGDTDVISRVIDGQFPNYKQVIPHENKIIVKIKKDSLMESLRRVIIFSREPSYKVVMNFKGDNLKIEAKTPELGEAEEEIAIESSKNENVSVGISAQFMLESLREMDSDTVKVGLTTSMSPVMITPDGVEEYISIIMPIQSKTGGGE